MARKKRDITVLLIGDHQDFDTYKKINIEKKSLLREGFEYVTTNYKRVQKINTPKIGTKKVIVIFCFPFAYWNRYIEHKHYKGFYGNRVFYKKFMDFWNDTKRKIDRQLKGKVKIFINPPYPNAVYRDKVRVINKLAKNRIPQPNLFRIKKIHSIQNRLSKGHQFFLKPRYGSMGKGITFLSENDWQTNFILRRGRIISRKSDQGWNFNKVTGNRSFLRRILNNDFLLQEALDSLILKGKKVDLRIYTFFNKVIFIYPRKNKTDKITTNITQGGRGDIRVLKQIPTPLINQSIRVAQKTSQVLGINFAGIDIIPQRDLKKVYVIDVNLFSGLPKKKTFNLARCLAEELGRLDDKNKLRFK